MRCGLQGQTPFMNGSRQEDFKPIPVTRGDGFLQGTTFALRQWVDLQLLTCTRFLKPRMAGLSGNVLDVGCGEMPFRSFLPNGVRYQGLDIEDAAKFGMHQHPDVILFDGTSIPFPANSCDAVLCTEVLEHVANPELLVAEMMRVLRPGGVLLITVPFSARVHHVPHDYCRFTSYGLQQLLTGFAIVDLLERGNDYAVIANKLVVLNARLLTSASRLKLLYAAPLCAFVFGPLAIAALLVAHLTMRLGLGSGDDPLGYACMARKPGQ